MIARCEVCRGFVEVARTVDHPPRVGAHPDDRLVRGPGIWSLAREFPRYWSPGEQPGQASGGHVADLTHFGLEPPHAAGVLWPELLAG